MNARTYDRYSSRTHYHSCGFGSSISETLAIVERGLRRFGISGAAVRGVSGLPKPVPENKQRKTVTDIDFERILEMTGAGYSQAQIAEDVGCAQSTISKELARRGHACPRTRGKPKGHRAAA